MHSKKANNMRIRANKHTDGREHSQRVQQLNDGLFARQVQVSQSVGYGNVLLMRHDAIVGSREQTTAMPLHT